MLRFVPAAIGLTLVCPVLTTAVSAQEAQNAATSTSITDALKQATPNERRYLEHIVFLAHPALEGRLPGEEGSALAEAAIVRTFNQLGLNPAFTDESYRQTFRFRQGGQFNARASAEIVEGHNVGAVLPGQGPLADQWIVVGAHHDHLGRGLFGSRGGQGQIHEGADDNASGTAAVLLAAELVAQHFADDSSPRRSIAFVTFSGEESGLNGSRFFAENPPMPLESIALMINMDMVGRVSEGAITVNGVGTGDALQELVNGAMTTTDLEVRVPNGLTSRSDHAEFYRRGVPVLFITEAIFPDEYHTPDDESWMIEFGPGAAVAEFAAELTQRAATLAQAPAYQEIEGFETGEGGPSLGDIKIRFGIKPGNYGDTDPGIAVAGVSPDTSAEKAGIQDGDRLLLWNGSEIVGMREWMLMMAEHEPGDIVEVTIIRDGQEMIVPVMLLPRN